MKRTIKEVVESYGVKLWSIGDGILRGFCPMHENKNTASFTVYEHTDSYFCFGESVGGDVASFISKMDGISYAEAKKIVDGETTIAEDIGQALDYASVIVSEDYGAQLNFAVSKYCRDLMLNNLAPTLRVIQFLSTVDKDILTKPVTHDILKSVLDKARQLKGEGK